MFQNIVQKTKRILIVEDSREWQRFHEELLKKYDKVQLEYDIAPSAREALELAQDSKDNPYDLIISDLQMETEFLPKFAGEWFVENIKDINEYKKIPVVIVSAAYNISFIAATLGVNYLSKRTLVSNPDSYYFMLDENL